MPRRRFYIKQHQIRNGIAVLSPDQAHHLRHVLRLRVGDEVELFDGKGLNVSGRIERSGTEIHVGTLTILETPEQRRTSLLIAVALIKFDRFEWMLQKGTELGVDRFFPLESRFSAIHIPAAKLETRLDRWRRIILEASKQSGRITVPEIQAPMPFTNFLAAPESAAAARFMLHEKAQEPLKTVLPAGDTVLLCIGPEGGWHASETQAAEQAGFRLVSMGSRILRAETAALAAVSILQFLLEGHTGQETLPPSA
jgi:16S rRNA (uracil1498-N3)-methyltransferase